MSPRTVGVLTDKCTSRFTRLVDASGQTDFRQTRGNFRLKEAIISDPLIRVEINSATSFSVYEQDASGEKCCGPIISTSVIEDFIIGCRRVNAQSRGLLAAKSAGVSIAWLLVTAYYCAFFSSIEISRLFGRISVHLDDSDLSALMRKCKLGGVADDFFKHPIQNFTGKMDEQKITFSSAGQKPHAFVWSNFGVVLKEVYKERGWIDAQNIIAIVTGERTPNPSAIRNEWNYKFADRFGPAGENMGRSFSKLLGNKDGISSWLKNTDWQKRGDEGIADSIAALCETSSAAVIDTYSRIRSAKLLEFL